MKTAPSLNLVATLVRAWLSLCVWGRPRSDERSHGSDERSHGSCRSGLAAKPQPLSVLLSCVSCVPWFLSCLPWFLSALGADSLTESLQKGLLEEEVNRDLSAAAKAYESAIKQTDAQRRAAATAVFRLGEVYRKLGRTNDAVAQYQRVLLDFADQTNLVPLARQNLLATGENLAGTGAAADFRGAALEREFAAQTAELARLIALNARLARLPRDELITTLSVAAPDATLTQLLQRQAQEQQQLATLATRYGPQHPEMQKQSALLGKIDQQIGERTDAILAGLRVKTDALQAGVESLRGALPGSAPALTPAAQRQRELLEQELVLVEEQIKHRQAQYERGLASREDLLTVQRESLSLRRQMAALESQQRLDLLDIALPAKEVTAPPFAPTVDPADVPSLQEEIHLVEQELQSARKKLENGKAEESEVRRAQREVLRLQRKLPENAAKERQIALLEQELKLSEDSLTEIRKKIETGVAPPLDEIPVRRELMAVQRELAAAERASAASQPGTVARSDPSDPSDPSEVLAAGTTAGDRAATPATNEESDEIKRIQAIIKNSPDLVNARNATPEGGTPLHKAAASGYLAVAEYLLANGADANATDRSRQSPLHLAAAGGHKRLCELLLAKGADVKASDYPGFTPFHLAVDGGYLAVSETLLAAGAEVNTKANPGGAATPQPYWESSPLHTAAEKGFPTLIELLLKHGAAINAKDRGGRTPLVRAILKAQPNIVRLLLEKGADPNLLDAEGLSPLFHAVVTKQDPLVRLLLDHKAEVDGRIAAPDPEGDWTVLFRAVGEGEVELTRLLLEAGANVNAQAASGITPVHCAVIKNVPATFKLLLEKKADVNVRDSGGNTPLHYAVENGLADTVEALLAAGADPNATGWTRGGVQPWPPLFRAIVFGEPIRGPLVSSLLQHGADVNARTTNGWTALHRAVQYNLDPVVELLVAHKADVNRRGCRPEDEPKLGERRPLPGAAASLPAAGAGSLPGPRTIPTRAIRAPQPGVPMAQPAFTMSMNFDAQTLPADKDVAPLHVAVANQNLELAKFLLEHGAEINALDANGRTPLHFAVNRRDLDLIRLLLDAKADPNAKDSSGQTPFALASSIQDRRTGSYGSSVPNRGTVIQAKSSEIMALLRERGAKAVVSDPRAITIVRTAAGYQNRVLTRGPNDWNRFTLGELVGLHYGLHEKPVPDNAPAGSSRPTGLPFPDFTRLQILRQLPGGVEETIQADLRVVLGVQGGDCGPDVPLHWGDVVEIPEADHPLNERWNGIDGTWARELSRCLNRTVTVTVKGQSTRVPLYLLVPSLGGELVNSGTTRGTRFATEKSESGTIIHRGTCWLSQVLQGHDLLRSSSDLSRVRVKRAAAATAPAGEWVIDCTQTSEGGDFWLRDGDVIEVPEKTEPAAAGSGVVRVLGEVNRPGAVTLEPGTRKDIIDALAECGGLTQQARERIEFTRGGVTRPFTLDALKAEVDPDKKIWLEPGDTIEVKEKVL